MINKDTPSNTRNSTQEVSSDKQIDFSKEEPISNIPQLSPNSKVDRGLVLKKIQELAPINITALARELPYSRSSVYYVVKSLEYAQIIKTRVILKDNHCERLVCIPNNISEEAEATSKASSLSLNKSGEDNGN